MARCGCGGGQCNCSVTAGTNITVGGSGSSADPFVISSSVACSQVRGCISGANGVHYDAGSGVISADLSTDPGNNLVLGTDTGLYVPAGGATIITDPCGLDGDGSAGDPLTLKTTAWPYPCPVDANGGVISCDTTGVLRGEPRGKAQIFSQFFNQAFPNVPVPAAPNTLVTTFTGNFTNPDPCRPAAILLMMEMDVTINYPANGGEAEYGFDGPDEMVRYRNSGSTLSNGLHWQATKVRGAGIAAAGAIVPLGFDVLMGRGAVGANYINIQGIVRAMFVTA